MLKYILDLNSIYVKLKSSFYFLKIKYFLCNIITQKKTRNFDLIYTKYLP